MKRSATSDDFTNDNSKQRRARLKLDEQSLNRGNKNLNILAPTNW